MVQRREVVIGAVLGLLLANWLLTVFAIVLVDVFGNTQWQHEIPVGMLLGQLMLTALWVGLGDGRWYLRLFFAIVLSFVWAAALAASEALLATRWSDFDAGEAASVGFMFLTLLLTASCVSFALRRMRNWRLTWDDAPSSSVVGQFQINDVLLSMLILGGALAAIRFLITIDSNFPAQIFGLTMYGIASLVITLAVLLLAYADRIRIRSSLVVLTIVLFMGALLATPDAYDSARRTRAAAPAAPRSRYFIIWLEEIASSEASALAIACIVLPNAVALRALGCRFTRPNAT